MLCRVRALMGLDLCHRSDQHGVTNPLFLIEQGYYVSACNRPERTGRALNLYYFVVLTVLLCCIVDHGEHFVYPCVDEFM